MPFLVDRDVHDVLVQSPILDRQVLFDNPYLLRRVYEFPHAELLQVIADPHATVTGGVAVRRNAIRMSTQMLFLCARKDVRLALLRGHCDANAVSSNIADVAVEPLPAARRPTLSGPSVPPSSAFGGGDWRCPVADWTR